ncbi:Gfo/Idh/MocA family protein [Microbacterium enclense]|uniref:Gfo/Idh/MocA family protein n=1 Tax=Microbacterium enclense TaxID=993073 RepID=UPI003D715478
MGVAGTGAWAKLAHVPGLAAHPGVELRGVWGRNPQSAAELASEYNTDAYSDLERFIDSVDAVAVAVPPNVQREVAVIAARRGRHLVLEKPLAETVREAEDIATAVETSGVAAVMCLPRFFDPEHRRWLDDARIAEPVRMSVSWRSGALLEGSAFAGGWRDGSGQLVDVGPHIVSQLEYVLGPIVSARTVDQDGLLVQFTHDEGRQSEALIDLRDPTRDEELYSAVDVSIPDRVHPLDFSLAYTRIIDQLLTEINDGVSGTALWSPRRSVAHVDIITALRHTGRWNQKAAPAS